MLLIMMAAFALILIVQFFFLKKPTPPTTPESQPAQTMTAPEQAPAATANVEAPAASTPAKAAGAETQTVVENDLYRIVFTNRGAQVKSWVLKKYKDEKGQPLDLVNPATSNLGLPLCLYTYDDALRAKLNSVLYVANPTSPVAVPGELNFEFSDGSVRVHKTLRFDHSYVVWLETEVTVNGRPAQAYPSWPAGFGDQRTAPS